MTKKKAKGTTLEDGRKILERYVQGHVAQALDGFVGRVDSALRPVDPRDSAMVTLARSVWLDPVQILAEAVAHELVNRVTVRRKGRVHDPLSDRQAIDAWELARMVYAGLCSSSGKILDAVVRERMTQIRGRPKIALYCYGVGCAERLFPRRGQKPPKRSAYPSGWTRAQITARQTWARGVVDREREDLLAAIRGEWETGRRTGLYKAIGAARRGRRPDLPGPDARGRALEIVRAGIPVSVGVTWRTLAGAARAGARREDAVLDAVNQELEPLLIRAYAAMYFGPDGTQA